MTAPLVGYQYVVLRCVPRVDRDEFVNVGVVLHSQGAPRWSRWGNGSGGSPHPGARWSSRARSTEG